MFKQYTLDVPENLFNQLSTCTTFEDIIKGRQGAVLLNYKHNTMPIVRTTTIYNNPAQQFLPIHYEIMDNIRKKIKNNIIFNNALIEIYNNDYHNMKYHTDQSLDLQEDSYICLFSCYENNSNASNDMRKLQIKNKTTKLCSEFTLNNNSIVLFNVQTNQQHLHKIVLESKKSTNRWLGITFRLSKTFIKFTDDIPYIYPNNKVFKIADSNERTMFLKHKSSENLQTEYVYPNIDYTISKSDMLPIN